MYFKDTYLDDIKPVMLDWLTNSLSGNSVADLPLNFTNRALEDLWEEKPWSQLEVFTEMTLDGNNYAIPDEVGKIIRIAEYDTYNEIIHEYKEGDSPDFGYSVDWGFTKAAGYAGVITFNNISGSGALKIVYIKALEKFTGKDVEYSYFPKQLLLLAAQRIAALDKGNIGEWQGITAEFEKKIKKFEKATHQVNIDTRPYLKDRAGHNVSTPGFSLGGNSNSRPSHYSNMRIP